MASKSIAGLQDPFKDVYMNGKSNFKLKSLLATIHTKFVNEKIIKGYVHFAHFHRIEHKTNAF